MQQCCSVDLHCNSHSILERSISLALSLLIGDAWMCRDLRTTAIFAAPFPEYHRECGFLLQLDRGLVMAVETDRAVTAEVRGRQLRLEARSAVVLNDPKRRH